MTKINAPIIGITTFCKQEEVKNSRKYNKLNCNYIDGIAETGGQPLLIPELNNLKKAKPYIDLLDGIIFSGGKDISPALYGEKPISAVDSNLNRDKWEIKLLELALEKGIPVLGICRGMQLINIVLRGTLYQDIVEQYNKELIHLAKSDEEGLEYVQHKIKIEPDTKLSRFLCTRELEVNSYHHQAVKELGENLQVSARSEGGIIEAIESENEEFLLGVQWHPEDLLEKYSCFNNLFQELVERARPNKK